MRRIIAIAVIAAVVIFGSLRMGEVFARGLERLMATRVTNGLAVLELDDWAAVRADGLRVTLSGHAPDTFARDLALETARATAPLAEVVDLTTASLAPPVQRLPVQIEILRDEGGLTLTGRFHGEPMRERFLAALQLQGPGLAVHDLTGTNAARPPQGWGPELDVAQFAALRVPNAYVRVQPGAVLVAGLARDSLQREALSSEILSLAGPRVKLTMQLREPLVVVAPFVFAAVNDGSGRMRLEACAARSAAEEAAIEAILTRHGFDAVAGRCDAALGGPSGDWPGAIDAGLAALAGLASGHFRLEYRTAQLDGAVQVTAAELEAVLAGLAAALPEGYALTGSLGQAADPSAAAARYWLRFDRDDGGVVLAGAVPGETASRAIRTFAAAAFGRAAVRAQLSVVPAEAPPGWDAAAMVALDVLSGTVAGVAEVAPGRVTVVGRVADAVAAGELHRLLAGEVPEGYAAGTRFTIDLPGAMAAMPPSPDRCAALLDAAVLADPVQFAPGSAVIDEASNAVLDRLAEILGRCAPGQIEVGGHTDSQGSEQLNLRLSRGRAEAVVTALSERGVPLGRLAPRGYGEAEPVASNETEEGRALNRRIEFKVAG